MIILDISIDTVADNLTARSRPPPLLGTGGGVPLLVAGQGAKVWGGAPRARGWDQLGSLVVLDWTPAWPSQVNLI